MSTIYLLWQNPQSPVLLTWVLRVILERNETVNSVPHFMSL